MDDHNDKNNNWFHPRYRILKESKLLKYWDNAEELPLNVNYHDFNFPDPLINSDDFHCAICIDRSAKFVPMPCCHGFIHHSCITRMIIKWSGIIAKKEEFSAGKKFKCPLCNFYITNEQVKLIVPKVSHDYYESLWGSTLYERDQTKSEIAEVIKELEEKFIHLQNESQSNDLIYKDIFMIKDKR